MGILAYCHGLCGATHHRFTNEMFVVPAEDMSNLVLLCFNEKILKSIPVQHRQVRDYLDKGGFEMLLSFKQGITAPRLVPSVQSLLHFSLEVLADRESSRVRTVALGHLCEYVFADMNDVGRHDDSEEGECPSPTRTVVTVSRVPIPILEDHGDDEKNIVGECLYSCGL